MTNKGLSPLLCTSEVGSQCYIPAIGTNGGTMKSPLAFAENNITIPSRHHWGQNKMYALGAD